MRNRTRLIAAAAAVTAAVAGGSAAAVASTAGTKPGAPAKTATAGAEPRGSRTVGSRSAEEQQGHEAIVAAVARELHLSMVRSALAHALRRDGYDVSIAADGATALATLLRNRHEAVVLDVLMPEPSGPEVCRAIRARGDDTPILMLTARDLVSDRVAGLDAGADDYLTKPFALEELRARLRALLRRSGAGTELLRFAGVELDLAAHQASRRGDRLPLTKTEIRATRTVPPQPWPRAFADSDIRVGVGV